MTVLFSRLSGTFRFLDRSRTSRSATTAGCSMYISVDFEVFGIVQGVFFRACTEETARKHGLVGWVKNTSRNTVVGQIQGPEPNIKTMKRWLQHEGSPMSRIDKCIFTNEHSISKLDYSNFSVKGY